MPIKAAFILPHPPVIIPEVGRGREKEIQRTIDAYNKIGLQISELAPETIVLLSPHAINYADYFHIAPGVNAEGNLAQFGAANVSVKTQYDRELSDAIQHEAEQRNISAGGQGEKNKFLDHASVIPLLFIQKFYKNFKLVKISPSGLTLEEHYRFGKTIKSADEKRSIIIIASGDLSHKLMHDGPYGFSEEGHDFDKIVTQAMASGDLRKFLSFDDDFLEQAGECGTRAFCIMAGCLDGTEFESELLSYEGPFGVGYAAASFKVKGESVSDEFVKLARYSLEGYVKNGQLLKLPEGLPQEMLNKQAGVFVSLKKHGELRGCIGTISPATASIADEILRNAVNAGTQDPRFHPVSESELDELVYSVDVLSEAERIDSLDLLDVKKYGVIVSDSYRRGLLLPNLEGVDTVEYQVAIALQKAGISPNEPFNLERFEVVRHK